MSTLKYLYLTCKPYQLSFNKQIELDHIIKCFNNMIQISYIFLTDLNKVH
jgi:hypothetical protein